MLLSLNNRSGDSLNSRSGDGLRPFVSRPEVWFSRPVVLGLRVRSGVGPRSVRSWDGLRRVADGSVRSGDGFRRVADGLGDGASGLFLWLDILLLSSVFNGMLSRVPVRRRGDSPVGEILLPFVCRVLLSDLLREGLVLL
jgi:hypothetical protein